MSQPSELAKVKRRFSAAAARYDDFSREESSVQRTAAAQLLQALRSYEHEPRNILELGCGTGHLTQGLLAAFPQAAVTAVDVSPEMLSRCRGKFAKNERLRCIEGDIESFRSAGAYELIVSSSALHWTTDLSTACCNLYRLLASGGWLHLACMTTGTLTDLRLLRSSLFPELAPRAELPSGRTIKESLQAAQFAVASAAENVFSEYHRSAGALLNSLSARGVTSGSISQGRRPLVRGELRQLLDEYDRRFRRKGIITANYKVLFIAARKGPGLGSQRALSNRCQTLP